MTNEQALFILRSMRGAMYPANTDDQKALSMAIAALSAPPEPKAEPVAWACSDPTRLNHLMSAAQYKSALPKNRTQFDVPLYAHPPAPPEGWRYRVTPTGPWHWKDTQPSDWTYDAQPLCAAPPAPETPE
jgi:hypothetical protein